MKSLYERENLKRGDIILCCGEERIFVAYIEGSTHPYICVYHEDTEAFRNNKPFFTVKREEGEVSVKPKEWYDDIPKEGVICWASNIDEFKRKYVDVITYKGNAFHSKTSIWKYATPVKPEECYKGE